MNFSRQNAWGESSNQNIDQENLLVEFIRENNSNKNDNCSHDCQNISSQLIFERMILNHFHIYASNYWKLGKTWVIIELKNHTLNFTQLTERRTQLFQHFSCLICLDFISSTAQTTQLQIWPCLTQVKLEKKSVISKPTELSSIKETKFAKSIFNSRVL